MVFQVCVEQIIKQVECACIDGVLGIGVVNTGLETVKELFAIDVAVDEHSNGDHQIDQVPIVRLVVSEVIKVSC